MTDNPPGRRPAVPPPADDVDRATARYWKIRSACEVGRALLWVAVQIAVEATRLR